MTARYDLAEALGEYVDKHEATVRENARLRSALEAIAYQNWKGVTAVQSIARGALEANR